MPPANWVPLDFLTVRVVSSEPPAICQLQVRFSYPDPGPHRSSTRVSALLSCGALYSPVGPSNLGDSGLPCVLTSLRDLRRVLDFFSQFCIC